MRAHAGVATKEEEEAEKEVDEIVSRMRSDYAGASNHVVAFSGGVDSSLTLALVHRAFPTSTRAVIGRSAALPKLQLRLARKVAGGIGVGLQEVETNEGESQGYVKNEGQACYYCKTALYTTLEKVFENVRADRLSASGSAADPSVVLYNGTNMDDLQDPTRVGLMAAAKHNVCSPLSGLAKADVRRLAKHLKLPNHNYAASPCLRSRLEFGVEATSDHLRRIERGEEFIRDALSLGVEVDMRLRLLAGGKAMVELATDCDLSVERDKLMAAGLDHFLTEELSFNSWDIRPFKSGGVAKVIEVDWTNHTPSSLSSKPLSSQSSLDG